VKRSRFPFQFLPMESVPCFTRSGSVVTLNGLRELLGGRAGRRRVVYELGMRKVVDEWGDEVFYKI